MKITASALHSSHGAREGQFSSNQREGGDHFASLLGTNVKVCQAVGILQAPRTPSTCGFQVACGFGVGFRMVSSWSHGTHDSRDGPVGQTLTAPPGDDGCLHLGSHTAVHHWWEWSKTAGHAEEILEAEQRLQGPGRSGRSLKSFLLGGVQECRADGAGDGAGDRD